MTRSRLSTDLDCVYFVPESCMCASLSSVMYVWCFWRCLNLHFILCLSGICWLVNQGKAREFVWEFQGNLGLNLTFVGNPWHWNLATLITLLFCVFFPIGITVKRYREPVLERRPFWIWWVPAAEIRLVSWARPPSDFVSTCMFIMHVYFPPWFLSCSDWFLT